MISWWIKTKYWIENSGVYFYVVVVIIEKRRDSLISFLFSITGLKNVHRIIFCQNAPLCSEVLVTVSWIELEDNFSGSIALAEVRNILFFCSSHSLKTREKYISFAQLALLSLYIFWGKSVYFSIFEWKNSQLCPQKP